MTMFLLMFSVGLLSVLAGVFFGVKHFLHARDAEWRKWAQGHGIDDGYPEYGYTRRIGAR